MYEILLIENLKSSPIVELEIKYSLKASAPYCSITVSGSIPLPKDFDILRFCSSRISPWTKTFLNGISEVKLLHWNSILATQKNKISYAVTKTSVG